MNIEQIENVVGVKLDVSEKQYLLGQVKELSESANRSLVYHIKIALSKGGPLHTAKNATFNIPFLILHRKLTEAGFSTRKLIHWEVW